MDLEKAFDRVSNACFGQELHKTANRRTEDMHETFNYSHLDEVAQIVVHVIRLLVILPNRQPRQPERKDFSDVDRTGIVFTDFRYCRNCIFCCIQIFDVPRLWILNDSK